MDIEVQQDFTLRKLVAEQAMCEPTVAWWLEHELWCPINAAGECACCGVLWFRGFRAVTGVNLALSPIVFPLN